MGLKALAARVISGATITDVSGAPYLIGQSWTAVSCPADTNEDTLATITVPANALGPNGQLRIWAMWSYTNNVNNKIMRVRYSGGAGTQYFVTTRTTQVVTYAQIQLGNVAATNSQAGGYVENSSGATAVGARTTSAVDTTAATSVVITGQKAVSGDVLTLEGYAVEVMRP